MLETDRSAKAVCVGENCILQRDRVGRSLAETAHVCLAFGDIIAKASR